MISSKTSESVLISDISAFVFDFDGVLTNNKVIVSESGQESVICSRADGIAFDYLNKINKPIFIISTETNKVVQSRGKKLNVIVKNGVKNKLSILRNLVQDYSLNMDTIFYTGNDINDLNVMTNVGFSACPKDSHPEVKKIASYTLNTRGGDGVVREIIENIFEINLHKELYT